MDDQADRNYERRKSPRVELKGLTGVPVRPGAAEIIDFSACGAQVQFPERLVPGNLYEMRLTFPDRQILARVLVTRSVDLGSASGGGEQGRVGCLAGIEFQGLDADDREYLESFVAGMSRDGG